MRHISTPLHRLEIWSLITLLGRGAVVVLVLTATWGVGYVMAQEAPVKARAFSIVVVGDAIVTHPWMDRQDPMFLNVVKGIRSADIAVANLEMVLTEYRGFPQADPGGDWLSGGPDIARSLAWAGFDMLGHANNHSFDYGSIGILETHSIAKETGLVVAGSGKDLQDARKPVYLERNGVRTGLVAMASTFTPYGAASRSRPDIHGRPGLNPLRMPSDGRLFRLFNEVQRNLLDMLARCGISMRGIRLGTIDKRDLEANLGAIREAAAKADYVVVSVHTHGPGPWLEDFAHQAVDAGADIFFAHGAHTFAGLEIYKDRPIFYGLGNFAFESPSERLPSEAYEQVGLTDDDGPMDVEDRRTQSGKRGFPARREVWEGIEAQVIFRADRLERIEIIPLDLGFGKPLIVLGLPTVANRVLGEHIIKNFSQWSLRYGTRVDYLPEKGVGIIHLSGHPEDGHLLWRPVKTG